MLSFSPSGEIMRAGPTLLVFGLPGFSHKIFIHLFLQVLFTADLKSFSSYGLEPPPLAPSPSDSPTPDEKEYLPLMQSVIGLQPLPITPSVSPLKRKWDPELGEHANISPENVSELCLEVAESWNVADRVKRRRRY